jgi:hypothetical protein
MNTASSVVRFKSMVESSPRANHKPERSLRKAVLGVAVVAVALGAVFVYWWFSSPTQSSWLAEGTYATYEGSSTDASGSVNLTVRLEIVECNSTSAKLQMTMNITSSATGTVQSPPITLWFDVQQMKYEIAGSTVTGIHEASIQYANKGTKDCTIYEYDNQATKVTLYVDKGTGWIIKITFTSQQGKVDVNLVDTNVPALK